MMQQGLLPITGAIRRLFERIRFFLGSFANGVCRIFVGISGFLRTLANGIRSIFLGVGPVLERVFPCLLSGRVTGHCGEPKQGGTK